MKPITVLIPTDSNSVVLGSIEYMNYLKHLLDEYNLSSIVSILETGTLGTYKDGVVVAVLPDDVYYLLRSKEDVKLLVEEHLLKGRVAYDLEIPKEEVNLLVSAQPQIRETRIVLRNVGVIDPSDIEEYIARDGYMALVKVLKEMKPEDVVEEIKRSGLRGRGGAGFPTGLKWEFTAKVSSDQKYIVCNADEGEPGTFKDRLIMEGDPHSVIEAMVIAGYAVGATKGYIYIRGEYVNSIRAIRKAIEDAYEYGFLGKDILGSGFDFDLTVSLGAGAYICGEETALLESIEGKAGRPRLKPPYPPQVGLFGQPTVINNVETLANVPWIIRNGAEEFRKYGTENSPGTKVFTLVGNVVRRGLVEVPMGITVRELVYAFGGGIPGDRKLKMVQTGGIAGTFIKPDKLDTPLDYDSFGKYGVSIGSGVILVVGDSNCAVDIALNVMEFFHHESCGKCTPCREGTHALLETLRRISKGKGKHEDIDRIRELATMVGETSFCGLGQSVPNPILTLLNNFEDEFRAHIGAERCPVGVCKFEKTKPKSRMKFGLAR